MSESESKVETKAEPQRQRTESERSESNESNPDLHFDPIIQLPLIDIKTHEENEIELLKLRAKLYRYDTTEGDPQFKERGTGEVKLLQHNNLKAVRLLMRRDKTLKLCANHYIFPSMELKNHMNNEKVFVWSTFADLSEDVPKPETLAIRFGSVENANKFKEAFESAKKYVSEVVEYEEVEDEEEVEEEEEEEVLSKELSQININDKNKSQTKSSEELQKVSAKDSNERNDNKPNDDQKENESQK